jgi:acyl-[acyl-carrier-protein]-phospholipid O-acyltransferase/long-chain-fatty-acid--[acyl-carrier-protein] ligase
MHRLMPAVRAVLRMVLRFLYRFEVANAEFLKTPGPVILLPNHVSWLDWLFLFAILDDDWHVITSRSRAKSHFILKLAMDNARTFNLDPIAPYALRDIVRFLQSGGRLVVFPEGHITRHMALRRLFDGVGFLIARSGAKAIPCYLRGVIRVPWVRHKGWTEWFPKVEAHIGKPSSAPQQPEGQRLSETRMRITTWVRDLMIAQQTEVELAHGAQNLVDMMRIPAERLPQKRIIEDVTGTRLTYRSAFLSANVLAKAFNNSLPSDQKLIGVMMPNVAPTPLIFMALWLCNKAPAMLNFASGSASMLACIGVAKLKYIITARSVIEKANINIQPILDKGVRVIFMEDVKARISTYTKLSTLLGTRLLPKFFDLTRTHTIRPQDTAVVLFTSGSEGLPKGVDLTHKGIVANLQQSLLTQDFVQEDRFFNAMPMFHSFGLVLGTFLPLVNGSYLYLYPTPLHYRVIPAIVYDRDCTVMFGTNTFLNGYARRSHAYDFQSIRRVFAGGEKVQDTTYEMWWKKYGIRIFEGYGATEFSPLITGHGPVEPKPGSCGRFLPGVEYKLEPVEGVPEGGRLFLKGPQMMRGYLNPDANKAFQALGGWYDTGDIAFVDAEGFVFIRGRAKRFAKISGEMVSLAAVEEAIQTAFTNSVPKRDYAVLSRPDANKGECLILVTNNASLTLQDVWQALQSQGHNNLSFPREIKFVENIPLLGTGKTDYRTLEAKLNS